MGAMQKEPQPQPQEESFQSHAYVYGQRYDAAYSRGQFAAAQPDAVSMTYPWAGVEARAATLAVEMMGASLRGQAISEVASYLAPQVSLSDVVADVEEFADQYNYCSENNISVPCLEDGKGEPLPINLAGVVHAFIDPTAYQDPGVARLLLDQLPRQASAVAESSCLKYNHYSPNDARQFFGERLRRFLQPRLANSPPDIHRPMLDQGLKFKVYTDTYGLRIHYFPAYWFNPNQVFGSPTSPVEAWIMPGRYRFGVAGISCGLRFDDGEFSIPPSEEAHLQI